jgi:hypothetical protein
LTYKSGKVEAGGVERRRPFFIGFMPQERAIKQARLIHQSKANCHLNV